MDECSLGEISKPQMAKSSPSKSVDDPAHRGPGRAHARSDGVGNANLGSLDPNSRSHKRRPVIALRDHLDALYHDTIAASEAARRWFDGPGRLWREELPPQPALAAAMEALGVTARLLAVMNWLLDPAHDGEVTHVGPVAAALPPPLPADHPVLATDGGAIALASRQLLARAHQLANAHGETP